MSYLLSFSSIIKLIFFIIFFGNNKVKSQDFKTLPAKILEEETELLEVKDYDNINLVITKKSLYAGINPELKFSFENEFQSNTVFATYNSEFILGACTNNNLLAYFNINSFEEKSLYTYDNFNFLPEDSICSLSVLTPYAFIVHTKISGLLIYLSLIRIKLKEDGNTIQLGNSPEYFKTNISLIGTEDFKHISCEAILPRSYNQDTDFTGLVCAFLKYNDTFGKYSYVVNTANFKNSPLSFFIEKVILESENLNYFKIQKINATLLRYSIGNQSFEIYQV